MGRTESGVTKTIGRRWALGMALGLVALALLVAGCSGGSKGNASATATGSAGGSSGFSTPDNALSATATVLAQTPTVTPKPGTSGVQGVAEFCAQPPSVAAQMPASIPAYPNADLRVSQTSGGNGIFGYCTTDDNNAIALFYSTQLGEKGWQNMKASAIENVNQIFASQGTASVIITIEPDPQVRGSTAIIIQTTGL